MQEKATSPANTSDANLTTLIATALKDITYPYYLNMFRNTDPILLTKAAAQTIALYDELENDAHAFAVLQKRTLALISRPWEVTPASEDARDIEAADFIRDVLRQIDFDQLCKDLMDAALKGFAVSEIIWDFVDGAFIPVQFMPIHQRRIGFDLDRKPRMLTRENFITGEELPERKFITHHMGGKDGNPYGRGLGARIYWPVFFKKHGITFWMKFTEKFGLPTAVGKYQAGMAPADQEKLLQGIRNIQHDAAIVVPEGAAIELLEVAQGAAGVRTFPELASFMDAQISEAVLGETLTTNIGDVGSRAAADTHNEVREEITDADADLIGSTLRRSLIQWLIDFNRPGARPPMVHRNRPENQKALEEVREKRANWMEKLAALGFKPSEDRVREEFGEGMERAEVLSGATPDADFAAHSHDHDRGEAAETAADLSEQLFALTDHLGAKMVDDIRAAVLAAKSPADAADAMLQAYGEELDTSELQQVLAAAFVLAELTAMDHANED